MARSRGQGLHRQFLVTTRFWSLLLIGQGSPRFSFAQHLKGHMAREGQKPCQSCISRFFVSGQEDSEVNRGRCRGGAGFEADEISSRRGSKEDKA